MCTVLRALIHYLILLLNSLGSRSSGERGEGIGEEGGGREGRATSALTKLNHIVSDIKEINYKD